MLLVRQLLLHGIPGRGCKKTLKQEVRKKSIGLPMEVLDQISAGVRAKRLQVFKDLSMPFYGRRKPSGSELASVLIWPWWQLPKCLADGDAGPHQIVPMLGDCFFCIRSKFEFAFIN